MSSTDILLENLKNYYLHEFNHSHKSAVRKCKPDSFRSIAKKLNCSSSVLLNWSSKRSFPSINQLIEIAYTINTEPYQLLIKNNTDLWEGTSFYTTYTLDCFYNNLRTLRLEKGIHESFFNNDYTGQFDMTYREFQRYINGKSKNFNLETLDKFSKILSVEPYIIVRGK